MYSIFFKYTLVSRGWRDARVIIIRIITGDLHVVNS